MRHCKMSITDDLIYFEETNNLFELECEGVKFWPLVRVNVFDYLLTEKYSVGHAHDTTKSKSIIDRIFIKFKQIYYILLFSPIFIGQRDVLIYNHPRRVKVNNVYECLYTDTLIKDLNKSYIVFESPYQLKHFRPIPTNNIKYLDYMNFSKPIYRFIQLKNRLKGTKEVEQIHELFNKLKEQFNSKMDIDNWTNRTIERVYAFKTKSEQFRKLLSKINPKIVIEITSYNMNSLSLTYAAKKMNIPVIELQHGVMGKNHIAYNYGKIQNLETFPDYIFLFGQYWKDVTKFPVNSSNIKTVGWPYFDSRIRENTKAMVCKEQKTIIFISDGQNGKKMSRIAFDLSNQINMNNYNIIYKLHPGEYLRWKNEYSWLIESKIEVVDNSEKDIHYYFKQSDIQIGVRSTAIYEGLAYSLFTIILKLEFHEDMDDLCSLKYAHFAESVDEIIKLIEFSNTEDLKTINTEYFWKKDSLNNMKHEIDTILRKCT